MSTLIVNNIQSTLIEHTNGTDALLIDSSGRVTKPNTPAFYVQRGYDLMSGFISGGTTAIATWNNVILNQGSNYSNATGRFTAPVAGLYTFSYMVSWSGSGNTADFIFYRNGSIGSETTVVKYNTTTGGVWINASHTIIYSLAVNDFVTVGAASYEGNAGNVRASFCGHLIG